METDKAWAVKWLKTCVDGKLRRRAWRARVSVWESDAGIVLAIEDRAIVLNEDQADKLCESLEGIGTASYPGMAIDIAQLAFPHAKVLRLGVGKGDGWLFHGD